MWAGHERGGRFQGGANIDGRDEAPPGHERVLPSLMGESLVDEIEARQLDADVTPEGIDALVGQRVGNRVLRLRYFGFECLVIRQ